MPGKRESDRIIIKKIIHDSEKRRDCEIINNLQRE